MWHQRLARSLDLCRADHSDQQDESPFLRSGEWSQVPRLALLLGYSTRYGIPDSKGLKGSSCGEVCLSLTAWGLLGEASGEGRKRKLLWVRTETARSPVIFLLGDGMNAQIAPGRPPQPIEHAGRSLPDLEPLPCSLSTTEAWSPGLSPPVTPSSKRHGW